MIVETLETIITVKPRNFKPGNCYKDLKTNRIFIATDYEFPYANDEVDERLGIILTGTNNGTPIHFENDSEEEYIPFYCKLVELAPE